jgi:sulfite reductase alpha subunit-like flavoprotein
VQVRDSLVVLSDSGAQPPTDGWTAEKPFHAAVAKAMWLTSAENVAEGLSEWGEKKRVIHLEVDLTGSGIEYTPGDSIGMCCPNPQFLVDFVFQRLKEGNPELASASLDTAVAVASSGSEEDLVTLRELLTYRLDLTGLPRKTHVLALAEFCGNPEDAVRLQWLCSKGPVGKQLWSEFIESQGVGIAELLYLLPSCKPTLAGIVACCGNLPPRFYSIASSPLLKKNIAAVAFSSVRYT